MFYIFHQVTVKDICIVNGSGNVNTQLPRLQWKNQHMRLVFKWSLEKMMILLKILCGPQVPFHKELFLEKIFWFFGKGLTQTFKSDQKVGTHVLIAQYFVNKLVDSKIKQRNFYFNQASTNQPQEKYQKQMKVNQRVIQKEQHFMLQLQNIRDTDILISLLLLLQVLLLIR